MSDPNAQPQDRPRVVVIGGGFGGLQAVKALRDVAVDITLVDRRNFHLFQPLVYQVATGALSRRRSAGSSAARRTSASCWRR
jgi:NADH:ubiquinone reductase (H+-translocating)